MNVEEIQRWAMAKTVLSRILKSLIVKIRNNDHSGENISMELDGLIQSKTMISNAIAKLYDSSRSIDQMVQDLQEILYNGSKCVEGSRVIKAAIEILENK